MIPLEKARQIAHKAYNEAVFLTPVEKGGPEQVRLLHDAFCKTLHPDTDTVYRPDNQSKEYRITLESRLEKGYFVGDIHRRRYSDPDVYVPISWISVSAIFQTEPTAPREKSVNRVDPLICFFPSFKNYDALRKETFTEKLFHPPRYVVKTEPHLLRHPDWRENKDLAMLRYPVTNKKGAQPTYPITDINLVKKIAAYLEQENPEDYLLFAVPVAFGIKLNTLLTYTFRDIREINDEAVPELLKDVFSAEKIAEQIHRLPPRTSDDVPVFAARRKGTLHPISRVSAHKRLSTATAALEDLGQISARTLEKTYRYFAGEAFEEEGVSEA